MQYEIFGRGASAAHTARDSEAMPWHKALPKINEQAIIDQALLILAGRLKKPESTIAHPTDVKNLARLKIGDRKHEIFGVFYLNAHHGVIAFEELFRGTLSQASVFPREVVINALAHNAATVIFTHNHPSGNTTPSRADEQLTMALKQALALVDVRVLDHVIVTATDAYSMAEHGLI